MKTQTASSTTQSSSSSDTGFTTREAARLHHATVSNWGDHRKKVLRIKGKSSRITTLRVDLRVWQTALTLCDGNPRRLQVIDAKTVIVHNNPR